MLEEVAVLNRQDRVDQLLRQIGEIDQAAFFAIAVKQVGNQLGFELIFVARKLVANRNNTAHLAAFEMQLGRIIGKIRIRSGINTDAAAHRLIAAPGRLTLATKTRLTQLGRNARGTAKIAQTQPLWSGI